MDSKNFEKSSAGNCIKTLKGYWAFLPNPLPPSINYDKDLINLLSEADRLLGELSGTGRTLLNPSFIYFTNFPGTEIISLQILTTSGILTSIFIIGVKSSFLFSS